LYAQYWLDHYAPDQARFTVTEKMPEEARALSAVQKKYLQKVISTIESHKDPEALQVALYDMAKEVGIPGKDAFQALYIALIGKPFGPKAGWFINSLDKNFVVKRLEDASKIKLQNTSNN
jgi:lysyl-tRNA synthetase class 1